MSPNTNDRGPVCNDRARCSSSITAAERGSGSVAFASSVFSGMRTPARSIWKPKRSADRAGAAGDGREEYLSVISDTGPLGLALRGLSETDREAVKAEVDNSLALRGRARLRTPRRRALRDRGLSGRG